MMSYPHPHPQPDAIVVGAGPAGAVTALLLARAGHDVMLIDRQQFPRAKPCGDCLSAGVVPLLDRLQLLDTVAALPSAKLSSWRIVAPDGTSFVAGFDTPTGSGAARDTFAIERELLDAALLQAGIAAGVRFLPGVRVQDVLREDGVVRGVVTAQGALRAPLTIGADGLRSVLAKRLDVRRSRTRLRKVSLTFHVDARVAASGAGEMHCGDGVCIGVAPLRDHGARCNVTLVADSRRYGRALARDPCGFTYAVVAALPRLRGRVPDGALEPATRLGSGPFDRPVSSSVFDGAALVGDAAGYYDPFTGQGVYQAMASAELLAPVASAALRSGRVTAAALEPYARARRALLRQPRALQQVIEAVLARPRLANGAIARIAGAPAFAHAIVAATGHLRMPVTLLSPAVLSTLIFPPRTQEQAP